MAEYINDRGGQEHCSLAERALIRRACVMLVELDRLEQKFAQMDEVDPSSLTLYCTITNSLRRVLESIGIERRGRDVTPDLSTYLRAKAKVIDAESGDVERPTAEA